MGGRVRDPRGRFSGQPDALTAARASRAIGIRHHVETALSFYAAPVLAWSRPNFGGVTSLGTGERGVLGAVAFLSLVWPGKSLLLGVAVEPMQELAKDPIRKMIEEAERRGMAAAVAGSTPSAWIVIETAGAPISHVYRAECDPAFTPREDFSQTGKVRT